MAPLERSTRAWHAWSVDEVLVAARTDADAGLDEAEAQARLRRDGPNRITRRRGRSALRSFLDQLVQPLVLLLIVAAVVSALLGDRVDAIVIAAVVLANAVIGFLQEHRAEQAIAALDQLVVTEATALRSGSQRRLPSADLVVGDLVSIRSGDAVPADLRLLQVRDLQVEEAALTGESVPTMKDLRILPPDTPVGDRTNLAFAGTAVTYGQATGIVVATGDATEAGRIAGMLAKVEPLSTPLTRRIAALSTLLLWLIVAFAALLFAIEAARGSALRQTFNAAVALAVGAIPEGLPAAVTILLAVGVWQMAKRRALIRRLPAVETLGSTTIICSDKTGTLTENRMTVTRVAAGGDDLEVRLARDAASASFFRDEIQTQPASSPVLLECLRAGALCNDARLSTSEGADRAEGDPTEIALLVAARAAGVGEEELAAWPRIDVLPFESQHMYMATLHGAKTGRLLYVKGSSDVLIARCTRVLNRDEEPGATDPDAVHRTVAKMAAHGLRVLCIARKDMAPTATRCSHDDIDDLTLIGLVGMIDPPRPEAKRAVERCLRAGIRVKMITGDHAVTASAIAEQLGLVGARDATGRLRAITGRELDEMDDTLLAKVAEDVVVFARVAPEQKLRLVQALQSRGHIVAMTGDGVNDAPALRRADIGVAMGRGGTDVARGAAAMILTDDNFATIQEAVEEGRGVFDNLVKFITWTLPTNGGEGFVLLAAVLIGTELPILPVQILWINMGTAVLLGTSLVFEPKEPGIMERAPRNPKAPLLNRALGARIVLLSVLIAGAALALFRASLARDPGRFDEARTVAANVIVAIEVGYLFACRSLRLPAWRIGLFSNRWVWLGSGVMLAAQLTLTYAPPMNTLFHTAPIDSIWWLWFTVIGVAVFAIAELKKLLERALRAPRARSQRRVPAHPAPLER